MIDSYQNLKQYAELVGFAGNEAAVVLAILFILACILFLRHTIREEEAFLAVFVSWYLTKKEERLAKLEAFIEKSGGLYSKDVNWLYSHLKAMNHEFAKTIEAKRQEHKNNKRLPVWETSGNDALLVGVDEPEKH